MSCFPVSRSRRQKTSSSAFPAERMGLETDGFGCRGIQTESEPMRRKPVPFEVNSEDIGLRSVGVMAWAGRVFADLHSPTTRRWARRTLIEPLP